MSLQMKPRLYKLLLGLMAFVVLSASFNTVTHAAISSCDFTMSPPTVTPGSDNFAVFSITNHSNTAITNLNIISPNGQTFNILSSSAYRWDSTTSSNQATFINGAIIPVDGGSLIKASL